MAGVAPSGLAELDHYAVSCAWTWLRYNTGQPTVGALYCTVEDPRVAAVELERADGAGQQMAVVGKRAVVFPYARDMQTKRPAQQPRAIRLFDDTGARLGFGTSAVADGLP